GLNYDFNGNTSVFGGVHKGVSTPSPRAILRDGVTLESSVQYEAGLRYGSDNFNAELVGFFTDFENIISTAAGLGLDGTGGENAGEAEVKGFEFLATYDPFQDRSVRLPLFFSATYTDASLLNSLASGGAEDIYSGGVAGAAIPYIPEWKVAAGIGAHTEKFGADLLATYVSDTFGTAVNTVTPINTSREGEVDGGVIVDLSTYYQINDSTKFLFGVHNLFEEVMVTSRIPEGPRVNAPREFYFGFEMLLE
ncbi:MAG: TonB-dependent receptor, partial [Verrucomicrobiota bacterium]